MSALISHLIEILTVDVDTTMAMVHHFFTRKAV